MALVTTLPNLRASVRLSAWVVVAVAAASCGANEPDQARPLSACDLVTRAEVVEVLGAEVAPPASSAKNATDALAGRSGCAWST